MGDVTSVLRHSRGFVFILACLAMVAGGTTASQAQSNSDQTAALTDIGAIPRLPGAKDDPSRTSSDRVVYSVAARLADTNNALVKLLGAEGWKPYAEPMENRSSTSLTFKKGPQALSVSLTIQVGKNEQTSQVTTVYYSASRLYFALAVPDDATDLVFDTNRPYLSLSTAGSVETTREFYDKQLTASGWVPLSADNATAKWPNAKLDADAAYFDRGNGRPIVLTFLRSGNKTNVEIRVAPFALPTELQADTEIFGLPRPKPTKTSGGTDGRPRELHAHVIAGIEPVLAFYRKELTARGWKEEAKGAVVKADEVVLNFTPPEGMATLKLNRKYDFTVVSLVQHIPLAAPRTSPSASRTAPDDMLSGMLKEAQQMMRDADAMPGMKPPAAPPANAPSETLRPLASNTAPVPVPENAEDVEFDGDDGKLEFTSPSSLKSVADFYRATMKQQGWATQSSVINNANMSVLNFSKGGKTVSFTLMKMGPNTNVTAEGSALTGAGGKTADKTADKSGDTTAKADTPSPAATEDDLIVEEFGGLQVPKRHTMAEGTKNPFRREMNANVPLALDAVLGFYRRELGKLNWKEEAKDAVVAADNVSLRYTAPEGPAQLKLSRKDGETVVNLVVKDPGAATKGGVMPKPGQVKFIFGNINEADATITFNGKPIKIAKGAGTKAPDGPSLDLPPGKYKYSIKPAGKPAQNEEVDAKADETWGLMVGPGGILALQAY